MESLFASDTTGYGRLVSDGHYGEGPCGLWGKHDNVRRFWENQLTRFALRPSLARVARRARGTGRGLRVADLGCGGGEGWELLSKVPAGPERARSRYLVGENDMGGYHGIDLCPQMVAQCRERFVDHPWASFAQGDLNDLPALLRPHQPFDLYYNSYGSLSHLEDDGLRAAIIAMLAHQPGPCSLVLDVHGQYSPEWPGYWGYSADPAESRMQPYNMIWMYPDAERARRLDEQRGYRVRYWRGDELRSFLRDVPGLEPRLRGLRLVDRSVFVGRHMDTTCFNPGARPVRREVNTLFEFNHVAKADRLRAGVLPRAGVADVDEFFATFRRAWNALVDWFFSLSRGSRGPESPAVLCGDGGPIPAVMRSGMQALAAQAHDLGWLDPGDPDANLLQPQFGLLLRQLEHACQRGLGCGHGLLAFIDVDAVRGPDGRGLPFIEPMPVH